MVTFIFLIVSLISFHFILDSNLSNFGYSLKIILHPYFIFSLPYHQYHLNKQKA